MVNAKLEWSVSIHNVHTRVINNLINFVDIIQWNPSKMDKRSSLSIVHLSLSIVDPLLKHSKIVLCKKDMINVFYEAVRRLFLETEKYSIQVFRNSRSFLMEVPLY